MNIRIFMFAVIFMFFLISSYSVTQVDSCQNITGSGSYIMNKSVLANGNCFEIQVDNVLFDCNNYNIVGNGTGSAISANSFSNITLKNCNIDNFDYGINLLLNNSVIEDIVIRSSNICIRFLNSFYNNISRIYFENCSSSDMYFFADSDYNIIKNSFFTGELYFRTMGGYFSENNTFYGNIFINSSLIDSNNWASTPNFFNYSGIGNKYLDYNGDNPFCFDSPVNVSCDYHPDYYYLISPSNSKKSNFPFSSSFPGILAVIFVFVFFIFFN